GIAQHDGHPLSPAEALYLPGREDNFIPELSYAVKGGQYLALTYVPERSDFPQDAKKEVWPWGLSGLIQVACLPDPDPTCVFLEDNLFGDIGQVYLKNESFCKPPGDFVGVDENRPDEREGE